MKICVVLVLTSLMSYLWSSVARSLSSLNLTSWNWWLSLFTKKWATSLTSRTIDHSLSSRDRSFWSSPRGMSPADLVGSGRCLSSVDQLGSSPCSSASVCLQVASFRSTFLFIGGGWCSGALVLCGLSTTTSRLSTTIMFARLQWGRDDDGGAPSALSSACSRRYVAYGPGCSFYF
jgi:hypothetical protein